MPLYHARDAMVDDLWFSPDDSKYIGYDQASATYYRPREVAFTRRIISSYAHAIGTTPAETNGIVLRNTTAGGGGAAQYSPSIYLEGRDEADAAVTFRMEVQAATSGGELTISRSLGGAAYAGLWKFSSAGKLYPVTGGVDLGIDSTNLVGNVYCYRLFPAVGEDSFRMAEQLRIEAAGDRSDGFGSACHFNKYVGNQSLVILNSSLTDAAHAIANGCCYKTAAAGLSNPTTMRILSVGWSGSGNAHAETQGCMADGSFIAGGALKSVVAASASGVLAHHYGTGTAGTKAACATVTAGLQTKVLVETLNPAAVETNLTTPIPAGCTILAVLGNCESALTGGGTTVTWSLGTAADPDKYGTAGYPAAGDSLAKNSKSSWTGAVQTGTSTEQIVLTGCATGGAADGDTALTVGSVKVMVIYNEPDAIPDAA